jgi:hypothetical protein
LDELRRAAKAGTTQEAEKALTELEDLEDSLYSTVDRQEVGRIQMNWGQLGAG